MVLPFETCTAEVFRPVPNKESRSLPISETRKDSAVHVSLSSSLLVKQPRTEGPTPLEGFRSLIRRQIATDRLSAVRFTHQNEELHEAQTRSWPRAKTAPRSVGRSINPPDRPCQRLMSTNRRIPRTYFATQRSRCFCWPCAVLEPQSCDVLTYS